jgi:aryl-alcohol dehydrogenase-like predicted oxidoreductase
LSERRVDDLGDPVRLTDWLPSAIVGSSRPEQLRDNAAASGVDLDDATLRAIEDAFAA